jgi:RNA-directed DNA polymerase
MQRIHEIVPFAKNNRQKLQKQLSTKKQPLSKSLEKFQKHQLNALYFLSIETPAELCRFLGISFYRLQELMNKPSYKTYTIKKKRNGVRQIFEPESELKALQKRLNYFLQAYYLWIKPAEVHGFVVNPHYLGPQCNIVENAKAHINKKHVLNIDLKDFFPGIPARQVKEIFSSACFNFSEQIAIALTLLSTFAGRLPTGAPTSPVISNFACLKLDSDLKNFASENKLTYTRYADDLTFSSDALITNDNLLDIILIINQNHFQINEKKVHLKASHRRQTVTGLTVNTKVNVNRKLLKKIRAMLHDLTTNGIDAATQRHLNIKTDIETKHRLKFIQRLEAYINFTGQVRGQADLYYRKQKSIFDSVFTTPI